MSNIELPPNAYAPPIVPYKEWGASEWDRPANYPIFQEREHFLATVHGFDAGGFEATIRCVDLQHLVDSQMRPRGCRKPVLERDEADMVRAVNRAKKAIRHAVKTIGATNLMTLTTREEANSPESLGAQWKHFVRAYRAYTKEPFPYVTVPERHPKNPNHWHLHIAVRGFVRVSVARHIWWACCGGRGMGNVDVQYIKVSRHANGTPKGTLVKSEKIARYLSKYITKDLLFSHRADKKRYWRSEFDMPEGRRYWLKARPGIGDAYLDEAMSEFMEKFGLTNFQGLSFFMFPDHSGFWCSYNPESSQFATTAPPPF